jgi:ubiquinone/menaquinone biosynthesis C-methylase UbiE
MEWYEVAFDSLYPVIYEHRDFEEAETVVNNFAHVFEGKDPILDLACGNGRYIEALSTIGHRVYGLDLSHYLLRMSLDSWGHHGKIVQGDMRRIPMREKSVGAVINMFTSFGYFSTDTDNLVVFKEVYRILAQDGVFLFDFLNAEKIASSHLSETERSSSNYRIKEKKRTENYGKYLVKEIQATNQQTGHTEECKERLRLYSLDELIIMFESVGFKIGNVFGGYDHNPFMKGVSERVIIVSRKE